MAEAFQRLDQAFNGPVPAATGWPFSNPPRVQRLLDDAKRAGAKPGAKSSVTTPKVCRLVTAVEAGQSVKAAAASQGMSERTARRVLAGIHPALNLPALAEAGVSLPVRNTHGKAGKGRQIDLPVHTGTHAAPLPPNAPCGPSAESAVADPQESRVSTGLRTPAEAHAEFERKGISVASWARENGVSRSLVYEILAGRKRCHRGDSHKIAVLLRLKAGELDGSIGEPA
jgi:gp16 family phage-associated protein